MANAFIIMQIGNPQLDQMASSAIVPALLACGLDPRRVDKHNEGGLLKTEIIRFIEDAEIIVADLTNERQNCYLEVGFALGIDKQKNLILCVREDHFPESENYAKGGPKVHFDLAGYEILRWHPNGLDEFRTELTKLVQRRLAILAGPKTSIQNALDVEWLTKQRATADEGLRKTPFTAYMEMTLTLPGGRDNFSLPDLKKAVENAPIDTFGWPIAVCLSTDQYRPRPRADGIVAEILTEDGESYDYWAIRRNGDFYWRGSLFEDKRRPGEIFFDVRIKRVTEALLYCVRLFTQLELDRSRVVTIAIRHVGLRGRHLTSGNRARNMRDRAPSDENESATVITVRLDQIEGDLVDLVKNVLDPVFSLFDFFELSTGVYEEIVNKFVTGNI
jgi:hypothetical protein